MALIYTPLLVRYTAISAEQKCSCFFQCKLAAEFKAVASSWGDNYLTTIWLSELSLRAIPFEILTGERTGKNPGRRPPHIFFSRMPPHTFYSRWRGALEIKFRRGRGVKKFADFPSPYFLNHGIALTTLINGDQ